MADLKLRQIAVAMDAQGNESLYGLDEEGSVWSFWPEWITHNPGGEWRRVSMSHETEKERQERFAKFNPKAVA